MGRPTAEQAGTLAPDANSLRAGRKLAVPSPWSGTGCNDRAVWGACRGSANLAYTVAVDTVGPAYKCSCPSRKSPCKHALALLLLWAQGAAIVAEGQPPPDVAAWLASRSATQVEGDLADAVAGMTPPPTDSEAAEIPADVPAPRARDPEAAKARAEQRSEHIAAGMEELARWLGDLLRHGLGHAQTQPYGFWDAMAARLVDAQAPAAANRVRNLAGVVRSGTGWPGRLLAQVCRLHLLAAGWARYRRLPENSPCVWSPRRMMIGCRREKQSRPTCALPPGGRGRASWYWRAPGSRTGGMSWPAASLTTSRCGPSEPGCGAWSRAGWPSSSTSPGPARPLRGIKYVGPRRLVEVAVATLATDRALRLLGVPGTAKTWLSENLAAAISGSST